MAVQVWPDDERGAAVLPGRPHAGVVLPMELDAVDATGYGRVILNPPAPAGAATRRRLPPAPAAEDAPDGAAAEDAPASAAAEDATQPPARTGSLLWRSRLAVGLAASPSWEAAMYGIGAYMAATDDENIVLDETTTPNSWSTTVQYGILTEAPAPPSSTQDPLDNVELPRPRGRRQVHGPGSEQRLPVAVWAWTGAGFVLVFSGLAWLLVSRAVRAPIPPASSGRTEHETGGEEDPNSAGGCPA